MKVQIKTACYYPGATLSRVEELLSIAREHDAPDGAAITADNASIVVTWEQEEQPK